MGELTPRQDLEYTVGHRYAERYRHAHPRQGLPEIPTVTRAIEPERAVEDHHRQREEECRGNDGGHQRTVQPYLQHEGNHDRHEQQQGIKDQLVDGGRRYVMIKKFQHSWPRSLIQGNRPGG